MDGPLSSLRVLDFTTLLPGPFATMLLADLGAQVIRVEAPSRGDPVREREPSVAGVSAWHATLNRSKRSLLLDLKQPGATEVVHQLVARYDIVVEQFRPGVMDRLGVGYEALRAVNPRLIYCAITGYGQDGPYRDRAGHDINYLALSGLVSTSGRREAPPPPLGVQIADVGAGSYGALLGILSAVIHRMRTGEGQYIDVSMYDGALAWNALAIADFLASGDNPAPESDLLNGGTYYDYYRTRDNRYLAVGPLEPGFWKGFCEVLKREDLIEPGLRLPPGQQGAVKAAIQEEIARRTLDEWIVRFGAADVCVEPVLTVEEAVAHPQAIARNAVVEVPAPGSATVRQVAHPLRFSSTAPTYRHIGPRPGEHSDAILREAGYGDEDIRRLRASGVLG